MTAALLCAATALFAWPAPRPSLRRLSRARSARPLRGVRLRPASPIHAAAVAAALGGLVGPPLVAGLAAGCAALAARGLRSRQQADARAAVSVALAEALGVLRAELQSGRSLSAAVATAVAACPDPLTGRALEQAVRGAVTGEPALGSHHGAPPQLRRVTGAVGLSVATGCALGEVLAAVENDLRAAHRLRGELRSATAGPRASAAVLAGLPVVGLAMGSGVGADPWAILTTTGIGQLLLSIGVALEVAGVAWVGWLIRRAAGQPLSAAAHGR